MSPFEKDTDRPLGLDGPAKRPPRPPLRARFPIATITAIAVIAGSSFFLAGEDEALRNPQPEVVSRPETPVASDAKPAGESVSALAPASEPASPGPSIIKVDPDSKPAGDNVIIIRDPSALGQNLRVAHLPDRALLEQSETGPLPIRAADGRRPVDVYARPWSGARGARVAIVIGGIGVSQTSTQAAIEKLPPEVTLGFAAQGNSLDRWMQAARREGHEIVVQVPLEPFDFPNVNPGRNTLTVEATPDENLGNLRWALSRTTNYTGVMNYMGARFVADAGATATMMQELGKRGLLYLDDGSSARTTAAEQALKAKVPFAAGDAVIDAARDRGDILKKLDELERIARAKGSAIGTGTAFDVTVDAVTSWITEAKKRGIEIVPVSALAADPGRG